MQFSIPLCGVLLCLSALPARAQIAEVEPPLEPLSQASPLETETSAEPFEPTPVETLDPAIFQSGATSNTASNTASNARRHDPAWARFASDGGSLIYLAAGTFLPLLTDGEAGGQHTLRTADALIFSTIVAEGLKRLTNERRPDGTDHQSFPSGHATAAFTVAAMQAHYHPRQALLWYAGAAAIGASRVTLDRHYTHDVLAGAALGYFSAQLELGQGRGLVLRPFVRPQAPGNRTVGLSLSGSF